MLGRLIDVISQSVPQDQDKECHEPTVGRVQQRATPATLRHWPDPFPTQHMCALAAGGVSARRKIGDTDEQMQRVCTASMQRKAERKDCRFGLASTGSCGLEFIGWFYAGKSQFCSLDRAEIC